MIAESSEWGFNPDTVAMIAAIVAAIPLVGAGTIWHYRRSHWHYQRRVESLTVAVAIDRYVDLLGPVTQYQSELPLEAVAPNLVPLTEAIFVSEWAVVQAVYDDTYGVRAFAVTALKHNFRPSFWFAGGRVTLLRPAIETSATAGPSTRGWGPTIGVTSRNSTSGIRAVTCGTRPV
jgi:hypothetical protein